MPIYEYLCNDCERPFEELVLSAGTTVSCPVCQGRHIERLLSVVNSRAGGSTEPSPAAGGGGTCCGGGCGCQ